MGRPCGAPKKHVFRKIQFFRFFSDFFSDFFQIFFRFFFRFFQIFFSFFFRFFQFFSDFFIFFRFFFPRNFGDFSIWGKVPVLSSKLARLGRTLALLWNRTAPELSQRDNSLSVQPRGATLPKTQPQVNPSARRRSERSWRRSGIRTESGTIRTKLVLFPSSSSTSSPSTRWSWLQCAPKTLQSEKKAPCKNFNNVPALQYFRGWIRLEDGILRPFYDITSFEFLSLHLPTTQAPQREQSVRRYENYQSMHNMHLPQRCTMVRQRSPHTRSWRSRSAQRESWSSVKGVSIVGTLFSNDFGSAQPLRIRSDGKRAGSEAPPSLEQEGPILRAFQLRDGQDR